mmetsp:Transcript_38549/g.109348  ORF Transcript_38549/g.109348 Transcript_38549/m.109348 type:complete len:201 (+) Transcript_38549:543-1145(+)
MHRLPSVVVPVQVPVRRRQGRSHQAPPRVLSERVRVYAIGPGVPEVAEDLGGALQPHLVRYKAAVRAALAHGVQATHGEVPVRLRGRGLHEPLRVLDGLQRRSLGLEAPARLHGEPAPGLRAAPVDLHLTREFPEGEQRGGVQARLADEVVVLADVRVEDADVQQLRNAVVGQLHRPALDGPRRVLPAALHGDGSGRGLP